MGEMASPTETKLYTLAEVAECTKKKETWVVIHNSVYNVTPFLDGHPGGEEVLLEQAGKDASEAFEDVAHSSDAREIMTKYKIGELVEADRTKVKQTSSKDWASDSEAESSSSWRSWIIPVVLSLLTTVGYRWFYYSGSTEE